MEYLVECDVVKESMTARSGIGKSGMISTEHEETLVTRKENQKAHFFPSFTHECTTPEFRDVW